MFVFGTSIAPGTRLRPDETLAMASGLEGAKEAAVAERLHALWRIDGLLALGREKETGDERGLDTR